MRWIPLTAFLLAAATSPALAQGPLDGRWAWAPDICANEPGSSDMVPSVFAGNEINHYESHCTITGMTAIGTAGAAWEATMDCAGEGEEWSRRSIFAIDRTEAGEPRLMIEIDRDEGYVVVRHYCD